MEENNKAGSSPFGESDSNESNESNQSNEAGASSQEAPEVKAEAMSSDTAQGGQQNNDEVLFGILAYLGILFLLPLLLKKDNEFCQFHAKQGMVLFFMEVIGYITVPIFGLGVLINLATFVLSIMGIIYAVKKEKKELPIVGDLVKKLNL